ncbi:MAG: alpha-mannosidase, partial [Bacteroidales bacterium]|nr:alpha-mannosidase [Bacteroidales bacterium]
GELLMDIHATGCYTSHSELKNINRRNEVLLGSVESAGVLADWYGAMPYPAFPLSEGWKRLVSHQFHDDLTGTSEPSVYQFTYSDEYVVRSQMQALLAREVEALSAGLDTRGKGIALAVYNPVPSRNRDCVRATVSLPAKYRSVEVYGPDGTRVPSQIVSRSGDCAEILFAADVPSLGVAVYDVRPSKSAESKGTVKASGRTLENDIYRIALDKNGDIASLVDKRSGRELVREGEAFSLLTWDDNWSGNWPAWEIFKHVMDRKPSRVASAVKISLEEQGPLRASLRVERTQGPSTFVQHIRLTSGAQDDRIDIFNEIDWQSKETLLKASFPTVFDAPEAAYDLGMAHVRRGVNTETSYEVYAHGWADMTAADGSAGLTVLNDSKYGWDHPDAGTLRLTLLHTPKVDRAYEQYQSTMDLGRHCFTYSLVSHDGVLDAAEATRLADGLNRPMQAYAVPSHKGTAGKTLSLASSTHPSLKIGAVKRAEDGDGYVVRVYELSGQGASGDIVFPGEIVSAQELNGIEDVKGAASFAGKALRVHADPFTLHTFRVRLASPAQAIAPADYVPLNLPFNTVALSSDGFSAFGHMDADWHSYAAELIPADFVFGGIPFALGRADYDNALRCGGQTLELPDGTTSVSLLVASSGPDKEVVFDGGTPVSRKVENWTGFYGAYGWQGHYDSFCRTGKVAYHGTHRHDSRKRNEIYVSTYMYLVEVPVTAGALRLPDDRDIVVFAATARR